MEARRYAVNFSSLIVPQSTGNGALMMNQSIELRRRRRNFGSESHFFLTWLLDFAEDSVSVSLIYVEINLKGVFGV